MAEHTSLFVALDLGIKYSHFVDSVPQFPALEVLHATAVHCVSPLATTALGGKSLDHHGFEGAAVSIEVSTNGGHDFSESGILPIFKPATVH